MAGLETLSCSQLNVTPSRKRKRQFLKFELEEEALKESAARTSCFTNEAFSSTPKKLLAKRRIPLKQNAENENPLSNVRLEISKYRVKTDKVATNPYEIQRKPAKKKKCQTDEMGCFENPALNTELPDKPFNPFEVVRGATFNKSSNCFSNPALNLKVQDDSVLRNPFEVQRIVSNRGSENLYAETVGQPVLLKRCDVSPEFKKKQNPALLTKPCQLKLGLPFVPRVGCRVDFNNISMSQLTSSSSTGEKLVLSPLPKAEISPGSKAEESTMDIGKELDRYQLELENSINEAKLRKSGVTTDHVRISPPHINYNVQMCALEKKFKFSQTLCGILEDSENEETIEESDKENAPYIEVQVQKEQKTQTSGPIVSNNNTFGCGAQYQRTETAKVIEIEKTDELYCSSGDDQEHEDSFDFKTERPCFVRAYRKPDIPSTKITISEELLECNISDKSEEKDEHVKKSIDVKNIIRKSIRKLIHPHNNSQPQEIAPQNDSVEKCKNKNPNGFMNVIRHSLRRKPSKGLEVKSSANQNDISIIDKTERTMKLKSEVLHTEFVKIEDLTNEKKHNLRNSIRKSTREVRTHFLKTVFHKKHEEYDCYK